jgi:hypothetical protein
MAAFFGTDRLAVQQNSVAGENLTPLFADSHAVYADPSRRNDFLRSPP